MTPTDEIEQSSAALRSMALLQVVVKADRPISLAEIAEQMGLPKPTALRLLTTLEKAGWVLREPHGKDYTVGDRLARLGVDIMLNSSVRAQRRAILTRIGTEIGETCNITMLDGNEVVYVDRFESDWPLKIDLRPGARVPLHCSASGKLMLSQMRPAKRRALLENLVLKRYTPNTITSIELLESELDRIRASQIATDNEEYLHGLICVAVPVTDANGQIAAALAVQAPTARLTLARAMEHVPMLKRAADAMAATITSPEQALTAPAQAGR